MPFEVIQGHRCRYQSKPVCNFILVINSKGHPISYRFEIIVDCSFKINFGHFWNTHLLVKVQPTCTKLIDAQVLPTSWLGRDTRGLHKEAVHMLSLQPASITSSAAFKPECNGLSQFREDTRGPCMPVRKFNLIACPLVQSS